MSLSGTFIYLILGPYYSNISCQRRTISVVILSNVIFLWSVYTIIQCPNIMVRNHFRVSAIINGSCSVVV